MRWWRRSRREEELDRELRLHLEQEARELRDGGLTPEQAHFAARRALGNPTSIREDTRAMWGWTSLERLGQDIRFAIRTLRKSPSFTIVAVISLALGISANAVIFSLVDGLWLRPMGVPNPGSIARLLSVTSEGGGTLFSYPEYLELRKQTSAFSGLVTLGRRGARIPNPDGTFELLLVNVVSTNFFQDLKIQPALGRLFNSADEAALEHEPAVVLGDSAWRRRFGGDPNIIGKKIRLERATGGALFTVMGVLPPSFREIETGNDRDLWLPPQSWAVLSGHGDFDERGFRWFRVLGLLAPGASLNAAHAQAQTVAARLAQSWPATNAGRGAAVISDTAFRLQQAGTNGWLLLGVVLLVVLLCSVNVANLLLARNVSRGREIAVRLAIGASRPRLMRQLMTENLLLGAAGLAGGLVVGAWLTRLLPLLIVSPPGFKAFLKFELFHFDSRVFFFSLAIATLTIVFFGLAPAWRAARANLVADLKSHLAGNSGSARKFHPRHWLVVSQVGISMILLAASGVLVRSFVNTRTLDVSLTRQPVLLVWLSSSGTQAQVAYREALERLRALPGVRDIAYAIRAPLSLSSNGMTHRVSFPDRPDLRNQPPVEIKYNAISANYLRVLGTPLQRGREFDERDQTSGSPVILINELMAQQYWPGQDALNQTIRLGGPEKPTSRIVGIVKNAPINALGETPEPYLYVPYWQDDLGEITFMVRTAQDPMTLAQPARHAMIALDPRLDPLSITTEQDLMRFSASTYQITAELVSSLGFLGLVLTAVGLYGVVSYGVSQRTREIGIRMALGAERGDTVRLVVGEIAWLGSIGIAIGLPLALMATRLASSMLFGVNPWDAASFVSAIALMALVLVAAGIAPARRATRVDPLVALRHE